MRLVSPTSPIDEYDPMVDTDHVVKSIFGQEFIFSFIDGQYSGCECFMDHTSYIAKNSHGFILIYDVTSMDTFERVSLIVTQLQGFLTENEVPGPILLVTNKVDLEAQWDHKTTGIGYAILHGCAFAEVSVRQGVNVQESWTTFLKMLVEYHREGSVVKAKLEEEIKSKKKSQGDIQKYIENIRRCSVIPKQ